MRRLLHVARNLLCRGALFFHRGCDRRCDLRQPFDGRVAQEVFEQEQRKASDGESLVARKLKRLQTGMPLV